MNENTKSKIRRRAPVLAAALLATTTLAGGIMIGRANSAETAAGALPTAAMAPAIISAGIWAAGQTGQASGGQHIDDISASR